MIFTKEAHSKRGCQTTMVTLSIKHEMFARYLIIHKGNQTKAYLEVYERCSVKSAPSKASRLVRNGNVLSRTYELLTGKSALLESAMRQIVKSLDAEIGVRCNQHSVPVPDYKTRLAAAKLAFKLMGCL